MGTKGSVHRALVQVHTPHVNEPQEILVQPEKMVNPAPRFMALRRQDAKDKPSDFSVLPGRLAKSAKVKREAGWHRHAMAQAKVGPTESEEAPLLGHLAIPCNTHTTACIRVPPARLLPHTGGHQHQREPVPYAHLHRPRGHGQAARDHPDV